jgi:hypothetical protein
LICFPQSFPASMVVAPPPPKKKKLDIEKPWNYVQDSLDSFIWCVNFFCFKCRLNRYVPTYDHDFFGVDQRNIHFCSITYSGSISAMTYSERCQMRIVYWHVNNGVRHRWRSLLFFVFLKSSHVSWG